MFEKKNEMKFTILFSSSNPNHVFAADKLNTQSRNNKSNYVAQAIKFYEENNILNKNFIENIVIDILKEKNLLAQHQYTEIESTNQLDEIDENLKNTITNSLDIFKRGS